MTSLKAAYVLLVLAALSSAFIAEDYIYSYEGNVTVTYENFTQNGNQYSIVSFDGKETFLLEDDEIVTNKSKIDSVLETYYLSMFYPTDDEIDDVRDLLDDYNESRNNGQKFPGKEEFACRQVLFIDGRVKDGQTPIYCRNESDEESCEKSAMLMYSFLSSVAETPPVGSPTVLLDPIKEFGYASYGTSAILSDLNAGFDAAETDRSEMYSALEAIEDAIPELEDNLDDIEDSLFGWTSEGTCDANHWCLCPDMDLDDDSLEDLEDQVGTLLGKMGPFDQYEEVSEDIHNSSLERAEHAYTERLASEYLSDYGELNATAVSVIAAGNVADEYTSNYTLSQDLSRLKTLHAAIPEDISNREFTGLDEDIDEYGDLIDDVGENAVFLMGQYNATRDAKHDAESVIVLLDCKDLDPVSKESLELLKNQTSDLDARFRKGLTADELAVLEQEYANVTAEAQQLLSVESKAPATRVLLLFRGFARNVNTGIADFAAETETMEPSEIPQSPLMLGLFSALVFLSMSSIVVLVFLYIVATTKFAIPKTPHILASAFLSIMIVLLGFSAFMYLFLDKTSTDATLTEFLMDFASKDSTTIAVDLRNSSYSDSLVMASCADRLAQSMEAQDISWTVYKITDNTCTEVTKSANKSLGTEDCLANLEEAPSSFVLEYSDTNEPPKFSVIYTNKAEIKANYDYYDSCPLVALFS
jgi:hypothetical protein